MLNNFVMFMDGYETEQLSANFTDAEQSERQKRRSINLEYQLPGKSTYLDKHHKQIIVAYWLQGDRGTKELSYNDFSSNSLGFNNKSVSSNNNFLEEIGVLSKGSKGSVYKLTDKGISLAEALNYKKEESAKKILKDIIKETWIYESIYKLFGLKEHVSLEDIIIELAHTSKADLEMHRTRLRPLVDYLEFTELIKNDLQTDQFIFNDNLDNEDDNQDNEDDNQDNHIEDKSTSSDLSDNGSASNIIEPINEEFSIGVIEKPIATNFKVDNSSSLANINVDISINLEITSEMTPDDIKNKLDAIISSFKDKE